jgi:hypothetical protein
LNIIFLDCDGVLNCLTSTSKTPEGYTGIDNKKVNELRTLVNETKSTLILIGSWKEGWERFAKDKESPRAQYLDRKLKRFGLYIYDKTNSVSEWLKKNEDCGRYVILDGGSSEHNFLNDTNYIKVNPSLGLTQKEINEALEKMK